MNAAETSRETGRKQVRPPSRRRGDRVGAPWWTWVVLLLTLGFLPWAVHTLLAVRGASVELGVATERLDDLEALRSDIDALAGVLESSGGIQSEGRAAWQAAFASFRRRMDAAGRGGPGADEITTILDQVEQNVAQMGRTFSSLLLLAPDAPEKDALSEAMNQARDDAGDAAMVAASVIRREMADLGRRVPERSRAAELVTLACCLLALVIAVVVVLYQRDIRRRRSTEIALKDSQQRYALVVRGANDGVFDWDLEHNEVYYSPRWAAMIGTDDGEIGDTSDEWLDRVHVDDLDALRMAIASHLEGTSPHFECEYRIEHADGGHRWMRARGIAVHGKDGKAYRLAGSQTDITERRKAEEQLLYDACHDGLTGLPNRVMFVDRLDRALWRARRRPDYMFAVLFLDLDRFKIINDSLGHLVGDQLLISIARRLESCLRPSDMVARLGGDEFTILLEDIRDVSDATRVAERVQEKLGKPVKLAGEDVFSSVSIGIAMSTADYDRAEDLLRDSDTAMYRAKAAGKARHEMFDRRMHVQAVTRLQMETDLRHAVENMDFEVDYQPVVDLQSGDLFGFEALVRWNHPERGRVAPGGFIPIAEETGLIVPIGLFVLREACRQVREWQARFPGRERLSASVNLSTKQFMQADLFEHVRQILDETGLPARCLKLEITESVFLENADAATSVLLRLKELGIQIYIDDFGTGYSSLAYLHRLPIDALKIDRSFVSRMGRAGENSEVVRTIVALARNLGMSCVAEGVETAEQLGQIRGMQCGLAQGRLFSMPVNPDAVPELFASAKTWARRWGSVRPGGATPGVRTTGPLPPPAPTRRAPSGPLRRRRVDEVVAEADEAKRKKVVPFPTGGSRQS